MEVQEQLVLIYDGLHKFALKLTKNADKAQDLVQETCARVLEKQSYYQDGPDANFFGWCSKIMFNLFVSQYRRATKFESQYDPEPYIASRSAEGAQEHHTALGQALQKAMKLPPHMQAVVQGVALGYKYDEMAAQQGVPTGTIRSRLSRARRLLTTC